MQILKIFENANHDNINFTSLPQYNTYRLGVSKEQKSALSKHILRIF